MKSNTKNRTISGQQLVNQNIFQIMADNGAVEGRKYNFDQLFTSASKKPFENLRKELVVLGYVADKIEQNDDEDYFIDAYMVMPFDQSVLAQHSLMMLDLAKKFKVFYDGWGVELASKPK